MDAAPDDVLLVPVRVCGGQIVVCADVVLPEGAAGEVRLVGAASRGCLVSPVATKGSPRGLPLQPAGTELRFLVRSDRVPPDLLPHTLPCSESEIYTPAGRRKTPRLFVSAILTQPLHCRKLSTGHVVLRGGACHVRGLDVYARSLHHAYILISEAFEPHRLTHEGNAWDKAHALHEGKWLPLRRFCSAGEEKRAPQRSISTTRVPGGKKARRDTKTGSLF